MTFSSYMEINIIIDIFLIVVLTLVVLPRSPKMYVAMLLLNLAQYAVIIPLNPESSAKVRFSWSSLGSEPAKNPDARDLSAPASNPIELMGRAQSAFSTVSAAMGGAAVPASPDTDPTASSSSSASGSDAIRGLDFPARLAAAGNQNSARVSLNWQSIMGAAIHDPHALWLGMRLFWLAAAFMLFIQRPIFGMAAACSNLIPIPFLVTAGPHLYRRLSNQEAVQQANAAMENPESLKEFAIQFATSNGLAVLLLAVIILGSVALLQRRRRLKALKRLRTQESYLDSTLYAAQLNGTVFEFNMDGNEILINGLRFNVDTMRPDPDNTAKWYIRPHNTLVFIPKVDPNAAPQTPYTPSYSYKRKR